MKKELLPTHEECVEKIKNNEASKLHIFIFENEPAGNKESDDFRTQLSEMITEREVFASHNAWEAGIISFCAEIGNDMSEEEENGIPIYDTFQDYLKAEVL